MRRPELAGNSSIEQCPVAFSTSRLTPMPRGVLGQGKSLGGLARGNRVVVLSWLTFLGSEQTRRGELHVLGSRELNFR